MGLKLHDLLKEQHIAQVITMENLRGKRLAIDGLVWTYQFLASIRGVDGEPLKDLQGNITSHLSGWFYRILKVLENGIRPIVVFDGKPHSLKQTEIDRRKAIRKEALMKADAARDDDDDVSARKYAQGSSRVTPEMIEETKLMLRLMGIPVINAAQDGESQAAYIVNKNDAWAVSTQDYDAFLYGATRVVRNLSQNQTHRIGGRSVYIDIEFYSLEKLLETLQITRNQLIDIGILMGTDFNEGIDGVGAKTALKLVKDHGSIERMIYNKVEIKKASIPFTIDQLQSIQNIFNVPSIHKEYAPPSWKKPNTEKIQELLVETHNFSSERVKGALGKFLQKMTERKQSSLDQFSK